MDPVKIKSDVKIDFDPLDDFVDSFMKQYRNDLNSQFIDGFKYGFAAGKNGMNLNEILEKLQGDTPK